MNSRASRVEGWIETFSPVVRLSVAYDGSMRRAKHIWIIPLLLALVVGGVGWWADRELRQAIEQEVRDDLQSALEANVTALEIWMENQKRIAASLAEEPRLKNAALKLLEAAADFSTNRALLGEMSHQFITDERLPERARSFGYGGMVQLVSTNLLVISDAGRRRTRLGNSVLEELQPKYAELFSKGEPILITPFKVKPPGPLRRPGHRTNNVPRVQPRFSDLSRSNTLPNAGGESPAPRELAVMQVAAPIKDKGGQTQGALALMINPDAEFTRILSVARSGESGETFAFDAEGVMISESRFDDQLKKLKLLNDEPEAVSALTLALRDPGGDLMNGFVAKPNQDWPLITMVERAVEEGRAWN